MSLYYLAKGIVLGLAIAAPVGPIGMLCINRTLERGFWAGVAGGLGTALADGLYAFMAAMGFSVFALFLDKVSTPLALVGGLFLLWLGWQAFKPKPPRAAAHAGGSGLISTTAATFALTMTNPATILSFAAIFAGLGLAEADGTGKILVVAGVFLGSMLWWAILSGGVALIEKRLPESFVVWVSRASGVVLVGFGLLAIATAFYRMMG